MSNLAVLLYQYVTDKPVGIPDQWVAEVKELGEGTDLPGENWQLMTLGEYSNHVSTYQLEYDTWAAPRLSGKSLIENYKIEEYNSDCLLLSISWYQDKILGIYTNLAKKVTYTYILDTVNLKQIDNITYNSLGNIIKHEITKFYTNTDTNNIITETEII